MSKPLASLDLSSSMRIAYALVGIAMNACGMPVTPFDVFSERDPAMDAFDVVDASRPVDELVEDAADTTDTSLSADVCLRDAAEDPEHCGPQCLRCPSPTNAVATCVQNRCGFRCAEGFNNCNGDNADGCEASLRAVTTCGTCANRCPTHDHETPSCMGGVCASECDAGWQRSGSDCVRMPIRPVLPFSGFEVSTRRPRFRWILPESYDTATLVICSDPECRMELLRVAIAAGSSEFVPVNPLPNGPLWWKLEGRIAGVLLGESARWQTWIPRSPRFEVGGSVRPIFDFDQDGWVDLVGCSAGFVQPSECWIVLNNLRTRGPVVRTALDLPPPLRVNIATIVAQNSGDIDGDGHPNVVVRTPGGVGAIYYLRAGVNTRIDRTDLNQFGGRETDVLGDVDLDGYADLRVARPPIPPARFELVWLPGTIERASPAIAVAFSDNAQPYGNYRWLGDRDGDGQAEYVLTTFDSLRLLRFSTNRASQSPLLWQVSNLALAVAPMYNQFGAADTNGDSQTDLLSCGRGAFGLCEMRNFTRVSADPRQGFTIRIDDSRDPVGSQIDGNLYSFYAGDLNGDGYDDVAVSHIRPDMGVFYNHVYVVAGRPGAQPLVYHRVMGFPEATALGYGQDAPAVGVGDYDRDGYDDLIIPSPFRTSLRIIRGGSDISRLRAEPLDSAAPRDTYYQISQ